MMHPEAKIIDWSYSDALNGLIHFEQDILAENPQLLQQLYSLRTEYQIIAGKRKTKEIDELEVKLDLLILEKRDKAIIANRLVNDHFEAVSKLAVASNNLRNVSLRTADLSYQMKHDGILRTRAETIRRDNDHVLAKKQVHDAAMAESLLINAVREALQDMENAAAIAMAAQDACLNVKARLDELQGKSGGVGQNGFQLG